MMELTKGLRQVPFLEPLEDFQLQHLIKRGKRVTLETGEMLFRKGDSGHCMYVILSGQIQIYLEANEGRTAVLRVLQPGEFFGEMALLDGGARSANALALEACELFVLERSSFLDLMTASPELLSRLFSGLTERLRATDERYLQEKIAKQTLWAEEIHTSIGVINQSVSALQKEVSSTTVTKLCLDGNVKEVIDRMIDNAGTIQNNVARVQTLLKNFESL